MKKTIYLSLALLALISIASSCNQNNEKKVYVKASLPNGWTANPSCGDPQMLSACGVIIFNSTSWAIPLQIHQKNNELFKISEESIMDLNVSKNLSVNVGSLSQVYDGQNFEYLSNTVLVEVFVNGSVYDSRTLILDGTGTQQSYNVIIE